MIFTDLSHRRSGRVEREDDRAALPARREVSGEKESRNARAEGLREAWRWTVELDPYCLEEILGRRAAQGIDHSVEFRRIERRFGELHPHLLARRFKARDIRLEEDPQFAPSLKLEHALPVDRVGARQFRAPVRE